MLYLQYYLGISCLQHCLAGWSSSSSNSESADLAENLICTASLISILPSFLSYFFLDEFWVCFDSQGPCRSSSPETSLWGKNFKCQMLEYLDGSYDYQKVFVSSSLQYLYHFLRPWQLKYYNSSNYFARVLSSFCKCHPNFRELTQFSLLSPASSSKTLEPRNKKSLIDYFHVECFDS